MNRSHDEARNENETPEVPTLDTPTTVENIEKTYQNQLAVHIILATRLFERIAFYSIATNLTVSIGDKFLRWQTRNILIVEFMFTGISYLSTLIFAIISDAKLGRAKTILLGFTIYIVGFVLAILTIYPGTQTSVCRNLSDGDTRSSFELFNEPCAPVILTMIIVIALGAGAVQSNIAVLGAEQVRESEITSRYFDKYMIAVNIGGVIAKLSLSFTHTDDNYRYYYIAYIVALGALIFAVTLFLIGWQRYIHVKPYDSVIPNCILVVINAFQTRRQYSRRRHSFGGTGKNSFVSNSVNVNQTVSKHDESSGLNQESLTFLDFAKVCNGGKFNDRIVNDVKCLRSAIIVFLLFIPYFTIYSQVNWSLPLQGQHMTTFHEPGLVTWVSLADPVTIIIGIIILHMFIYKRWNTQVKHISIATKFVIGMIFAYITMCITGSIEMVRQDQCNVTVTSNSNVSSLSIYTQIPQYMGIGLSEIFAMIATYEFAYYAAPRSAKSLFMSVRFFLLGIVSLVGALGVYFYHPHAIPTSKCLNEKPYGWIVYTYFFLLAGFQLLFIVIFMISRKRIAIFKLNFEN